MSDHAPTTADPARGPDLPDVRMHVARPNEPVRATVVSNELCTGPKAAAFTRHIAFDLTGTPLAGVVRPGQSFGVLPPGEDERGRPHKLRLYSVASPTAGEDGRGNHVATTVKRLIDEHHDTNKLFLGVASNYLCDLKPGDAVELTGPSGKRFLLPARPEEHDYVLFSTGTGIAPFRGMVLDLLEHESPSKIVLISGSAYRTDLPYDDALRELDARHERFTYLPTTSRQDQETGGLGPMYVQERIASNPDTLLPLLESARGLVYVCGIAGMELGILRALHQSLPAPAREGYLTLNEAPEDPAEWTRRMIHKAVKPTRRVFLEVY